MEVVISRINIEKWQRNLNLMNIEIMKMNISELYFDTSTYITRKLR